MKGVSVSRDESRDVGENGFHEATLAGDANGRNNAGRRYQPYMKSPLSIHVYLYKLDCAYQMRACTKKCCAEL